MSQEISESLALIYTECYVCLGPGENLSKPCNNLKCSARAHPECIKKQYLSDHEKSKICGNCSSPIIKTKKKVINNDKRRKSYLQIIFTFFMIMVGVFVLPLIFLGRSVVSWNIRDDSASFIFLCVFILPLIGIFLQLPCLGCQYNILRCEIYKDVKYKVYLTTVIMFFVACGFILSAHLIGLPIVKIKYNNTNYYFTWISATAGFLFYGVLFIASVILFLVYVLCMGVYEKIEQKFSEEQIEFGVIVDN